MIELPQMNRRRAPSSVRPRARWFRIENSAEEDSAELYIYDAIYWFGVDVNELVDQLQRTRAGTLHVRINSPGGDVFDGVAIYNALVRHAARVVVHVDGLAASIASVIAMAGDEIRMHEGSMMMIHDPWMLAIGPASEMRAAADLLEKVGRSISGIYEKRTGLSRGEISELMAAETWMDPEEAREKGFADELDESEGKAGPANRFDLSAFRNVPDQLAAPNDQSEAKIDNIRDFEAFLREAGGFSRNAARAIAAGGFKATESDARDEPDGGQDAIDTEVVAKLTEAFAVARLEHSIRRMRS